MKQAAKPRVVVLYAHPILGEGLATLLNSQAGVQAVAVDEHDDAARAAALGSHPDLIILEESDRPRSFETSGSMPVVFMRVDASGDARLGQPLADPEAILALARDLSCARDGVSD